MSSSLNFLLKVNHVMVDSDASRPIKMCKDVVTGEIRLAKWSQPLKAFYGPFRSHEAILEK